MFKRSAVLIAAILAIGLLLLGCGSDDGSDKTSAGTTGSEASAPASEQESSSGSTEQESPDSGEKEPPSDQGGNGGSASGTTAFISQANTICKETGGEFFKELRTILAGGPNAKELDASGAEKFTEEAASPALDEEVEQLRALDAPPSYEKQFNAVVESIEKTAEEAKTQFSQFYKSSDALAEAEELAKGAGLVNCPFS